MTRSTNFDPRFQIVQHVIVSRNTCTDRLNKKAVGHLKERDTLIVGDRQEAHKTILLNTVPADIEVTRQRQG